MSTSCREYIKRLEKENKVLRQQLTKEKEEKKKIIKMFSNTQKGEKE